MCKDFKKIGFSYESAVGEGKVARGTVEGGLLP